MTAVFFFKDESSMKARQTVFFAYKSPEASPSLEGEKTLMWCHPIWENMWQKLAVSRCNATHKWLRLLKTGIPGFIWVYVLHDTAKEGGSLQCVFARVQWVKAATWCFAASFLGIPTSPPPHPPTYIPHISMQKSLSVRNDDNFRNASTASKLFRVFG